ncbi:MAG: hypothetical protein ABIP03_15930, partial [Aquihabitans sp.]
MTANFAVARQIRRWWPRRASGLPPGQSALDAFPRFADNPLRPPPATSGSILTISSVDNGTALISLDEVRSSALVASAVQEMVFAIWTLFNGFAQGATA